MSDQESVIHEPVATEVEPDTRALEPIEDDGDWLEPPEGLPRRARWRLLSPLPLALIAVLLTAAGFIGGVLVEKGEVPASSSSGAGSGLAGRLAAARSGRGSAAGVGAGSAAAGSSLGGSAGAGGGATVGQVSFVQGGTLYVTTAEGNTVKVLTSAGSTVTKTAKSSVKGIHPGETVVVSGAASSNGEINAQSIRVGAGGLGAVFSRSGSGAAGSTTGGGGASRGAGASGGGEPALFGKGGG